MAGLLILKRIYNLGDESIVYQLVQNPYFQYFCGESEFQWIFPCDPSDLVHFRKRIGKEGVDRIFKLSVELQKDEVNNTEVMVDTTVQEKDITFPTDSKLHGKIIKKVQQIARKEDVKLRQSYSRTTKKLRLKLRFAHHPKRKKEAKLAMRKLKTIAGRLVIDIERKLPKDRLTLYLKDIDIFKQVLEPQKKQ
jgi:IS5 family transposase